VLYTSSAMVEDLLIAGANHQIVTSSHQSRMRAISCLFIEVSSFISIDYLVLMVGQVKAKAYFL
jgi:hypothetical protein